MATALEKIDHHLKCGICQERYTHPKVLDCQHNFCQNCLEEYYTGRYKDTPKIPCPVCLQETVLPDTRIQGLKTNFLLTGIIEEISEQEKLACSEEKNTCQKHQGEKKRFYCETCQELICNSCAVLDHCKPQHHYIDIGEASLKYKHSLQDIFLDFNKEIKGLEKSLTASSDAQQEFAWNVTKTVKAVQDRATKMRAEITSQEKKLIDKIQQIQQDRNQMYAEHQKTISTMLQGKQYSLTAAQDFIDTASESDFLSFCPIISKDLESLKSPNLPWIDPKLSYLRFSPGQRVDEINLGQLEVTADTWEKCHTCREFGKHAWFGRRRLGMVQGIAATQPGEFAVVDCWNKRVVTWSNEGQHKQNIPLKSR